MSQLKIVVVGDPAVGKTCLLTVFKSGQFPTDYVPTVFENSAKDLVVRGERMRLVLWDTAGQEDMDRVRIMSYNRTDVVLVCYSVDSQTAKENVKDKWMKEISKHAKGATVVLVGLKTDLRAAVTNPVSQQEGVQLSTKLDCALYTECSAKESEKGPNTVTGVFESAVKAHLDQRPKPKSACVLL